MKVDVIIPTWNSEKTLASCLKLLRKHIPVEKIIIVDRESEDRTLEIAKSFGCQILFDTISLGSARLKGVNASNSELILFIDDDIMVDKDFTDIFLFLEGDTGAVQGIAVPDVESEAEAFIASVFERTSEKSFILLSQKQRGYTNATLIRRSLLTDIELGNMDAYEDWVISRHVISKGYLWKVVPIFVVHNQPQERILFKSAWNAAGLLNMSKVGKIEYHDMMDLVLHNQFNEIRFSFFFLERGDTAGMWRHILILIGIFLGPYFTFFKVRRRPIPKRKSPHRIVLRH
jgi:glycosyltransferase involved in cell wall biosynthesis